MSFQIDILNRYGQQTNFSFNVNLLYCSVKYVFENDNKHK